MSANNSIGNCTDGYCENDENYYCNAQAQKNKCLSLAAQLLACAPRDQSSTFVSVQQVDERTWKRMDTYEKHSEETLTRVWHIQCTIIVTLIAFALARVARQKLLAGCKSWSQVYLLEFIVIATPVIVSVNIVNKYVEYILLTAIVAVFIIVWRSKCFQRAAQREFEFGRRPALFTLIRSTINLLTALCILAIDFESFPKKFRKSRRYGAGLMDVGIGLFVFSMAIVSSRPKRLSDLRKLAFTVGCMLGLGLARTIVITSIDYHQDEHEYGVHLNAFFTLGFTKLFGTLAGFVARKDKHLLPLGLVILVIHEITLQCGISAYVMYPEIERTNFIAANREGLCSLPGFIALYILAQYFGQWIKAKDILNYEEIKQKLKHISCASVMLWLIVIISILAIGIARVTCNLGYVIWTLAISVTMCSLYLFIFDIVLDTLSPFNNSQSKSNILAKTEEASISDIVAISSSSRENLFTRIPLLIESINYNGLLYFLLGNVLTGAVNIFFKTDEKTDTQSVGILMGYMFIITLVVSVLYRYKIRIA